MASTEGKEALRFDETSWHDYMAKITATLPDDVARNVMHTVDEAGATAGAMLMLEILRRISVRDNDELAELAREAIRKKR
jgi:hypothetical protein